MPDSHFFICDVDSLTQTQGVLSNLFVKTSLCSPEGQNYLKGFGGYIFPWTPDARGNMLLSNARNVFTAMSVPRMDFGIKNRDRS
jgi:hypothetical protein